MLFSCIFIASLLLVCLTGNVWGSIELYDYNPVAQNKSTFIVGNARFTVLTSHLIRMEYSSKGTFTDKATLAVVNRDLPVPSGIAYSSTGGVTTINTGNVTLTYQEGQEFSASSLTVTSTDASSAFQDWHYNQPNPGNLLGTIRTLDLQNAVPLNCTLNADYSVHDEGMHCAWGLISRDGWAILDDTGVPLLNAKYWWAGYNHDDVDIYLLAHGHNYRGALADYIKIGGKIAMTPRFASGIMFTRWYNYNAGDALAEIAKFRERSFPMDVFIFDMNWHLKNDWTGFSFDPNLIPYPSALMSAINDLGVYVGVNIHDADGVASWEDEYTNLCDTLGLDPSSKQTVQLDLINSSVAYAVEDVVMKPVMDAGVEFAWIDWQQGGQMGGLNGGDQNPTMWLNHLRATDNMRQGSDKRGMVLARWGGMGNHRYQVGFSGDVLELTWSNLAYQPYFSYTASNVGFGFWSHDIEGPNGDLEMYTRWLQWGAWSGVMRSHDRGMSAGTCVFDDTCASDEPWNVPRRYSDALRSALIDRASLIPYIYTAHRQAFDSGVSLLRPMYYDYPENDNAYAGDMNGAYAQYMFGDDLLVAPIVEPGINATMVSKSVWLPPGNWLEKNTGVFYTGASDGSTILTKQFDLSEVPVFVKGGAIVPTIPIVMGDTIGLAMRQYTALVFSVFPGASVGETTVYEDDGNTTAYAFAAAGTASSTTRVSYERTKTKLTLTINPAKGSFKGQPQTRQFTVRAVNSALPSSVTVNGDAIGYAYTAKPNTWRYDGADLSVIVTLNTVNISKTTTVVLTTDGSLDDDAVSGYKGILGHASMAKFILDEARMTPGQDSGNPGPAELSALATIASSLSFMAGNANAWLKLFKSVPAQYEAALDEIESYVPGSAALINMYNQNRQDNVLCGTWSCKNINNFYEGTRVEGYQPEGADLPLYCYFNADTNDNWVTTDSNTPDGYSAAVFNDGAVSSESVSGSVPLMLYYNSDTQDHLTVASDDGIAYAKKNNYTQIDGALGYVLSKPPSAVRDLHPTDGIEIFKYAYALLQSGAQ